MYNGKYTLSYKFSKNWDITRMHKQCVPGLALLGEEGPGDKARNYLASDQVETRLNEVGSSQTTVIEFFHESKELSENASYCIMSAVAVSTAVLQ